jgi:hypothetical protein
VSVQSGRLLTAYAREDTDAFRVALKKSRGGQGGFDAPQVDARDHAWSSRPVSRPLPLRAWPQPVSPRARSSTSLATGAADDLIKKADKVAKKYGLKACASG